MTYKIEFVGGIKDGVSMEQDHYPRQRFIVPMIGGGELSYAHYVLKRYYKPLDGGYRYVYQHSRDSHILYSSERIIALRERIALYELEEYNKNPSSDNISAGEEFAELLGKALDKIEMLLEVIRDMGERIDTLVEEQQ
jgi:hypothetical protein